MADLLSRPKLQCHAIITIAQTRRCRAVIEDVAVVAAAAGAVIFRSGHPKLIVFLEAERAFAIVPEAWPAGAAIIFGRAIENRQIAAGAMENALALFIVQRRGEGALSGFLAQHAEGERLEPVFPLGFGELAPLAIGEISRSRVGKGLAGLAAARAGGDQSGGRAEQKGTAA